MEQSNVFGNVYGNVCCVDPGPNLMQRKQTTWEEDSESAPPWLKRDSQMFPLTAPVKAFSLCELDKIASPMCILSSVEKSLFVLNFVVTTGTLPKVTVAKLRGERRGKAQHHPSLMTSTSQSVME